MQSDPHHATPARLRPIAGEGVRTASEVTPIPPPPSWMVKNTTPYRDVRNLRDLGGVRTRVGMVVGNTTETFRFEKQQGQLLRVEVVFVAGGGFVTEEMQVWPGETASLVISPASGL